MARVRRAMRRTLALWLLLFGVYAATLGLDAFAGSDYGGDEPHYLLAAHSIVHDGDVDVLDEYDERAYAAFYPHELAPHGEKTDGRLNEPHGVGFPLLIAPAYALGGAKAVELFLAALAALAMALAYRLALRVVPDPWALGAARAAARHARDAEGRVALLPPARRTPVARDEVRRGGPRDRRLSRPLDL